MNPEKLLAAIKAAMETSQDYVDAATWKESKWDTPELVPVISDNSVNADRFQQFEKVLNFLVLGIFGVDEEGRGRGQLVEYYLKDTTRDAAQLPYWRIPKTRYGKSSLRDIVKAREFAQFHAESTRKLVEQYDCEIQNFLKLQFIQEDFKARAKDCKACEGSGYLLLDRETYRKRQRNSEYGDRFHKRTGSILNDYFGIPFRGILCDDCQPDEVVEQELPRM